MIVVRILHSIYTSDAACNANHVEMNLAVDADIRILMQITEPPLPSEGFYHCSTFSHSLSVLTDPSLSLIPATLLRFLAPSAASSGFKLVAVVVVLVA